MFLTNNGPLTSFPLVLPTQCIDLNSIHKFAEQRTEDGMSSKHWFFKTKKQKKALPKVKSLEGPPFANIFCSPYFPLSLTLTYTHTYIYFYTADDDTKHDPTVDVRPCTVKHFIYLILFVLLRLMDEGLVCCAIFSG